MEYELQLTRYIENIIEISKIIYITVKLENLHTLKNNMQKIFLQNVRKYITAESRWVNESGTQVSHMFKRPLF